MTIEERLVPITQIAVHEHNYGRGTIGHWSVPAIIGKSIYMRRLQAVHYFSDLQGIFQTTYEHHIMGTSKIMEFYPVSVAKMWMRLFIVLVDAIIKLLGGDNKENATQEGEPDEHVNVSDIGLSDYIQRLKTVAPLPSLIGMLAAPPYRRPFGTSLKRRMIRELSYLLYYKGTFRKVLYTYLRDRVFPRSEELKLSDIESALKGMRDNLIQLYKTIIDNSEVGFLPDIEELLDSIPGEVCGLKSNDKHTCRDYVLKKYKGRVLEYVEMLYSSRLTPFDPEIYRKSFLERSRIRNWHVFIQSAAIPAHFLFRYRVLSSFLALGYIYNVMLIYLSRVVKSTDEKYINSITLEIMDSLLQTLEAVLTNHSSTLLLSREVVKIKRRGMDREEHKLALIGVPEILALEEALFDDKVRLHYTITRHPEMKRPNFELIDVEMIESDLPGICTPTDNKKEGGCRVIVSKVPLADAIFEDWPVPCCVLHVRKGKRESTADTLKMVKTQEEDKVKGVLVALALARRDSFPAIGSRERDRTPSRHSRFSPFLSYFELNLVQADVVPSAYQLDLVHRLNKDIGMGIWISPEVIDDLVLNIDYWSLLIFSTLNMIYHHIFKDPTVIASRKALLLSASSPSDRLELKGLGCKFTKEEDLTLIYFSELAKRFLTHSKKIEKLIKKIEKNINKNKKINKILKDRIDSITKSASKVSKILEYYYTIIDKTIESYIFRKYKKIEKIRENESKRKEKELDIEKIKEKFRLPGNAGFENLTDYNVKALLGLHDTLQLGENIRSGKEGKEMHDVFLTHKTIPILKLYLDAESVDYRLVGKYNGIGYIVQTLVQTTYSPKLEGYFVEKLRKLVDPDVDILAVQVRLPSQGVLKPYFHLPSSLGAHPRIAESLSSRWVSDAIREKYREKYKKTKIEFNLNDIINIIYIYDELISQFEKGDILSINAGGLLLPLAPNTDINILPDPSFWHQIGPSSSKLLEYNRYTTSKSIDKENYSPRMTNIFNNLIIEIILKTNKYNLYKPIKSFEANLLQLVLELIS